MSLPVSLVASTPSNSPSPLEVLFKDWPAAVVFTAVLMVVGAVLRDMESLVKVAESFRRFRRVRRLSRAGSADGTVGDRELDRAADSLAKDVRDQWLQEAGKRGLTTADPIRITWGGPTRPLAGPVAAALSSQRFPPLPGLGSVKSITEGSIDDLHAVYGGLGSGRLIIAGPAGSGKSGAAVLLILRALEYREKSSDLDRPKIPVPVLVTAHDWNPRLQPVSGWLVGKLQESYPRLTGVNGVAAAEALVASGRISIVIDGLDEIDPSLRPEALQALSQATGFRMVVLSRRDEMESAASRQGVLLEAAAIELRPVLPDAVADYLERVQVDPPPEGWKDLLRRLRADPAGPLSKALGNPLSVTLIRDTYQSGDDARELLEFCDAVLADMDDPQVADAITDHLIDRLLSAAYAGRIGQQPGPYGQKTAENTLIRIAAQMKREGTRDLAWWHIPAWKPPLRPFVSIISLTLAYGLPYGLAFGLAFSLAITPFLRFASAVRPGIASGLTVMLTVVLAGLLRARRGKIINEHLGNTDRREQKRSLFRKILRVWLVGSPAAVFFMVLMIWFIGGLADSLGANTGLSLAAGFGLGVNGLGFGLMAGFMIRFMDRLARMLRLKHAMIVSDGFKGIGKRELKQALAWKTLKGMLVYGIASGLLTGISIWLILRSDRGYASEAVEAGVVYGFLVGSAFALIIWIAKIFSADPNDSHPVGPIDSWHNALSYDRKVSFAIGPVAGVMYGIIAGLVFWLAPGSGLGYAFSLVFGVVFGFGLGLGLAAGHALMFSLALSAWLSSVRLAVEWNTPIRLMKFLNDAYSRNILRTVGPVYQFRHARLQDRLAATVGSPEFTSNRHSS